MTTPATIRAESSIIDNIKEEQLLLPEAWAGSFPGLNGKIVFIIREGNNYDIATMNPDSSAVTRLTNTTETNQDPRWSPDGTKITFSGNGTIYVMNAADGSGLNRLTNDTKSAYLQPDGVRNSRAYL